MVCCRGWGIFGWRRWRRRVDRRVADWDARGSECEQCTSHGGTCPDPRYRARLCPDRRSPLSLPEGWGTRWDHRPWSSAGRSRLGRRRGRARLRCRPCSDGVVARCSDPSQTTRGGGEEEWTEQFTAERPSGDPACVFLGPRGNHSRGARYIPVSRAFLEEPECGSSYG